MNVQDLPDSGLEPLLARTCAGDTGARNELFDRVYKRLAHIAHRLLAAFPGVRRWDEAGDVLDGAVRRLLIALAKVKPVSMTAFFALASSEIRREYLDRARRYSCTAWRFTHGDQPQAGSEAPPPAEAVLDLFDMPEDLEDWTALQEEIERLPTSEREVASLHFHHGWTQARMAELFCVSERTIRHRWRSAEGKLRHRLVEG